MLNIVLHIGFLFLKSDLIEHNIIVETKNVEFFEHICPLKINDLINLYILIVMPHVRIREEEKERGRKLFLEMTFILI